MALDTVHLLHSLQIMECCAVGISMGGMIAQELALILPHRLRALVLCATHPGGNLHISTPSPIYKKLTSNEGLSHDQVVEKNIPLLFSPKTQRDHPEIIDKYRRGQEQIPEQPAFAFEAQQEAIQTFDCSNRLSNIKPPTLVLTGQDDILIPPENSHLLAKYIPRATLQEIPNAGHAIHIEQTDIFNQYIATFLKRHISK
jgi:pimeloyl-ACP methyl ester carboxylesterase